MKAHDAEDGEESRNQDTKQRVTETSDEWWLSNVSQSSGAERAS